MPFTRQDPPFVNLEDDPNGPRINAAWHNKIDKGTGDAHDELANHAGDTTNPHGVTATQAGAAPRLSPALNLMPDSGRYGGKQNPMGLTTPGAYTNLGWLGGFNGTTDASAGKFIHNNTTNGGTAGALTQPVIDLLAAMGRTSFAARYGTEFRVPSYTMGTGTAAPLTVGGITRYLAATNGARAMFGPGALNTFAAWVRCTAASVMFKRTILAGLGGVVRSELNGVEQASDIILAPADGWKHVLILARTFAGYDGSHPYIYAESGATFEIACPYFAAGEVNLDWRNDHAAPLPTTSDEIVTDATAAGKGVTRLSVAPVSATEPIAAGDNDTRLSNDRTPTDASVTALKMAAANKGVIICESTTRPASPVKGQHIYEIDTEATLKNNGTPPAPVWTAVGAGAGGAVAADAPLAGDGTSTNHLRMPAATASAPGHMTAEAQAKLNSLSVDGRITPSIKGATPGEADSTLAIQAAVNEARTSYSNFVGGYQRYVDLEGRMWRVSSIDMTQVRSPGLTIKNGGLYGVGGNNVLDLAGSNTCRLENVHIWGDKTSPPNVGFFLAKGTDGAGGFPDAKGHKLINCSTNGYFSKAGYVNFASEVCTHVGCSWANKHRSISAVAIAVAGHAGTFDQYIGGVSSSYTTIPIAADGPQSCILHDLGHLQAYRTADVNLPITSITQANPAVVTVGATALQNSGLANGDKVYFYNVEGMTQLNKNAYAVAGIDTVAGTFQLSGIDSTAYATFVSGNVQNQTGPGVLLGSCSGLTCKSGYILTYGSDSIRWDMQRGPVRGAKLAFQAEHQTPSGIFFDIAAGAIMQDITLDLYSIGQEYRDAVIKTAAGDASVMRMDGLKLTVASMGGTLPVHGLFQNRQRFDLRHTEIRTPLAAALTPTMAANFAGITGEVFAADTNSRDRYGTVTQR